MTNLIKLHVFDLDGTLSPQFADELYPDAVQWFANNPTLDWAIATNQGGVGLRYWMESGKFGDPAALPTAVKVWDRMMRLFPNIPFPMENIFVSFSYLSPKGYWSPIPPIDATNPSWRQDWRKPAPGMIEAAMRLFKVYPQETLMIGDREEDRLAAEAAHCSFQWAWQFFNRPEPKENER